jgi:general secretion pathway protein I
MTAMRAKTTNPPMAMHRQRGFTLVEVLVALAVVAVALAAGSQAADVLLRLAERQTQQWLAQQCADQALIAVRLEPTFPDPGERTLACEQGGTAFAVVLDIGTTPNPSFRRVQARVALAAQPQQTLLRTTTIVGRH